MPPSLRWVFGLQRSGNVEKGVIVIYITRIPFAALANIHTDIVPYRVRHISSLWE